MATDEVIAKRDKMKKWVSVAALGVVGFLVAPIIFLTIKGLIGFAIAAATGFTLVMIAPVFALKIANLKYRLIDSEKVDHIKKVTAAAAENPIETMVTLLHANKAAFARFETNVENAVTARDTFKGKVKKFADRYPHRAAEFQAQLDRMVVLVTKKKSALVDAKKSLTDGEMKLEEMKAYWEMSQDAQELNKAAGMETSDAFEQLKADTACDSVFESMNRAFAQLEVAAALDEASADIDPVAVAQLSHSETVTVDVQICEQQKVSR